MSVQDAEQFTREVQRYAEARRASRQVRNVLSNLNAALTVASAKGVDCDVEVQEITVLGDPFVHRQIRIQCKQYLEANEPSDWVLDRFRETAEEIAHDRTSADNAAKIQCAVDFMDANGWLDEGCFTFPDGDTWYATGRQS